MKNLQIITLTAICMMTGISLLEAATQSSAIVLNGAPYPISVKIHSMYKKTKNGGKVTRHDNKTIKIAAGSSSSPIAGTINYDGGVEDITVINLSNTDPSQQQTTKKDTSNKKIVGTATKNIRTITISDDANKPGTPVIKLSDTSDHNNL